MYQNSIPRKPNNIKVSKKTEKAVKFIENQTKDYKDITRPLKEGMLKIAVRITPH